MAEYIEREPKCGDCIHADLCERVTILKNFNRDNIAHCKGFKASADVVEVVHGEWVENIIYPNANRSFRAFGFNEVETMLYYTCSLCNTLGSNSFNYCPKCGAKMDGERWSE